MQLSTLSFKWKPIESAWSMRGYFECVIDDVPLTTWIDNALNNFISRNNYIGTFWGENKPFDLFLKLIFLGQPVAPPSEDLNFFYDYYEFALENRIILYTCQCGDFGCAGYWADFEKIEVDNVPIVKWSFRDELPPFYFNEQQYENAIEWVFSQQPQ